MRRKEERFDEIITVNIYLIGVFQLLHILQLNKLFYFILCASAV
jgi:hypothetical protein